MLLVSLLRTGCARFPFFLNTVKYKDENTIQNYDFGILHYLGLEEKNLHLIL